MGIKSEIQPCGVIPALILPLNEQGDTDWFLLGRQVDYLCCEGINGLLVNGTTGEGGALTTDEKVAITQFVKSHVGSRAAVYAACIQPDTDATLRELEAIEAISPDFIVAVPPFYHDVTQATVVEHYVRIAESAEHPVLLYNIPQRTGNRIGLDAIADLASVENIVGIKDSSADFPYFVSGVLATASGSFSWIQGDDRIYAASLLVGASGVVSGLSNIDASLFVRLVAEYNNGASRETLMSIQRRINQLMKVIDAGQGRIIASIKAATAILGRCTTCMIHSPEALAEGYVDRIRKVLATEGFLSDDGNFESGILSTGAEKRS